MGTLDTEMIDLLREALGRLEGGFSALPDLTPQPAGRFRGALLETAERLHNNYPYHHPLYIGQMLKPPHPVARTAYALAMWLNPNNHALDGSRASSPMEKEAVAEIAAMFGWKEEFLGHLTGGGTIANFEALWVSRELRPEAAIAASSQAHYTHSRLSSVLGVPFVSLEVDAGGRLDVEALEARLADPPTGEVPIGTVVATLGTTAAGLVDPLPEILALKERYGFRLHVDTAYGGYFRLAGNLEPRASAAYEHIHLADSIVVDPHKHGLQPYGCGCVLFRDPAVSRFYQHDSPYTYFSSSELHGGEISLECSRAGAAAVALWTTQRALPLETGGEFAGSLDSCREAALELYGWLQEHSHFVPLFAPDLDIVVWAVRGATASSSNRAAREIFEATAERDLHLALATFPRSMCEPVGAIVDWDGDELCCLRACAMKPEHKEWMGEILARLGAATDAVTAKWAPNLCETEHRRDPFEGSPLLPNLEITAGHHDGVLAEALSSRAEKEVRSCDD